MNTIRLSATITATVLALLGGAVIAQSPEEVSVQATRGVNAKVVGHTSSGVPINDLSLTYGVSLYGLNLATHSGATEAEQRVHDAALAACKEIGRQYPDATPSEKECAEAAAAKAMVRLNGMIASAEKAKAR